MILPHSRPKVHRPPLGSASRPPLVRAKTAAVVLSLALLILIIKSYSPPHYTTEMTAEIAPAQHVDPAREKNEVRTSPDMVVIKDANQAIIGQMTRIPVPTQPSGDIKTVTHVDNASGKELLSIVNRY